MQSEADIRKVLTAAEAADPDSDDDITRVIQNTPSWVLGGTGESADTFIAMNIEEA